VIEIPTQYAHRLALRRGEVAEMLGCSERFVDRLIRDGTLGSHTLRKTVFVTAADVWGALGICSKCPPISAEAREIVRSMG
jgi:excisionase family DNA binding protein